MRFWSLQLKQTVHNRISESSQSKTSNDLRDPHSSSVLFSCQGQQLQGVRRGEDHKYGGFSKEPHMIPVLSERPRICKIWQHCARADCSEIFPKVLMPFKERMLFSQHFQEGNQPWGCRFPLPGRNTEHGETTNRWRSKEEERRGSHGSLWGWRFTQLFPLWISRWISTVSWDLL